MFEERKRITLGALKRADLLSDDDIQWMNRQLLIGYVVLVGHCALLVLIINSVFAKSHATLFLLILWVILLPILIAFFGFLNRKADAQIQIIVKRLGGEVEVKRILGFPK